MNSDHTDLRNIPVSTLAMGACRGFVNSRVMETQVPGEMRKMGWGPFEKASDLLCFLFGKTNCQALPGFWIYNSYWVMPLLEYKSHGQVSGFIMRIAKRQ